MEISEYKTIFENEETHFFYVANHKLILLLVKKYFEDQKNLKILDAGCGTGLLAKKLQSFGTVVGIDVSYEALNYARKRGIKVKKASVGKIPFKKDSFDLVVSVDVLYHIQVNDNQALREFYRVLKPGGILILRVPALNWLRRSCDLQVHTRERYSLKELKNKLVATGFKVRKLSFINFILLPPALLSYLLEKILKPKRQTPLIKLHSILNSFVGFLLSVESFIIFRNYLPIGLGLLAVGQKTNRNEKKSDKNS